jgi:hypothetical protein
VRLLGRTTVARLVRLLPLPLLLLALDLFALLALTLLRRLARLVGVVHGSYSMFAAATGLVPLATQRPFSEAGCEHRHHGWHLPPPLFGRPSQRASQVRVAHTQAEEWMVRRPSSVPLIELVKVVEPIPFSFLGMG